MTSVSSGRLGQGVVCLVAAPWWRAVVSAAVGGRVTGVAHACPCRRLGCFGGKPAGCRRDTPA
jgi:hypothetical protein